jgi:hypothetical protein
MIKCGGVLVPKGDGWRRVCFVEERGLATSLAIVVYQNGTRPLQMSSDHYLPKSVWPEDGRLHDVHYYCQLVQGRLIADANGGRIKADAANKAAGYPGLAAGLVTQASVGYSGLVAARSAQVTAGHPNLTKAICQRWQVNRGKPCTCGQHKTTEVEQ